MSLRTGLIICFGALVGVGLFFLIFGTQLDKTNCIVIACAFLVAAAILFYYLTSPCSQ